MVKRREFITASAVGGLVGLSGCISTIDNYLYGSNKATITLSVENTQTREYIGLMLVESTENYTPLQEEEVVLELSGETVHLNGNEFKQEFVLKPGESVSVSYSMQFIPESKTVYAYAGQPSVGLEVFQEIPMRDKGDYQYQFSILNQEWSEIA